MKASQLRKIYLASVFLYGTIDSNQLFKLIKHYKLDVTKSALIKDLESRVDKKTVNYYVGKKNSKTYFLVDTILTNDEFNDLVAMKYDKPYYYPSTFEDFLKYADISYVDEEKINAYKKIISFLKEHDNRDEDYLRIVSDVLINRLIYNDLDGINDDIKELEIHLDGDKDYEKFINLLIDCHNNLRLPSNNGFTPNELHSLTGTVDVSKMLLLLGKLFKEAFLNGELDPYEFLKEVKEDEMLPLDVKDCFINALEKIIEENESIPKA